MAGSAVRDLEATGATEQLARLFGFLVAMGAAIFLMGWISLAMFYALTIGVGNRLDIVWIALLGSTPIATVVVYAVG